MSGKDYRRLYRTQDKVLQALKPVIGNFYLTGGTALGRFYLNHRFSEDLDFFLNKSDEFADLIRDIETVLAGRFSLLREQSIIYEDFVRFYIEDEEGALKVDLTGIYGRSILISQADPSQQLPMTFYWDQIIRLVPEKSQLSMQL